MYKLNKSETLSLCLEGLLALVVSVGVVGFWSWAVLDFSAGRDCASTCFLAFNFNGETV